jgi:uncharacterized membrane-anchored protein
MHRHGIRSCKTSQRVAAALQSKPGALIDREGIPDRGNLTEKRQILVARRVNNHGKISSEMG